MRSIYLGLIALVALATIGCQGGKEEYKVDANDPSSVENASKSEPVVMSQDGTPVGQGGTAQGK